MQHTLKQKLFTDQLDSQVLLISSRNGELVPIGPTVCERCLESPRSSDPAGQVLPKQPKAVRDCSTSFSMAGMKAQHFA